MKSRLYTGVAVIALVASGGLGAGLACGAGRGGFHLG